MFFIYNDSFVINAIPFGIAFILFAFASLRQLLLALVFFSPLSIELSELIKGVPMNMSLPTEPILFGIMGIFFLKLITERQFDKKVLVHPITISIYGYLLWMFITSITSEMPAVSFKYFLARVWFVVCFYFLVTQLVADKKYISKYILAYTAGMTIVVIYALILHAMDGFTHHASYRVMQPFFRDHTSYGAALALLLPAVFVLLRFSKPDFNIKFVYTTVLVLLVVALIFSYTRAAWGSIAGIIVLWGIAKLKIRFRSLVFVGIIGALLVIPMYNEIMHQMSKNDQDSSTNFASHIRSMSNISTDASNLERINRWKCAYRMFEERPVFGWGPGTYMFQYAPFQHSEDRTIISTNAADLGNAHSEYLGSLSESGLMGTLTFLWMIIVTMIVGFRVYHKSTDNFNKEVALFLTLALITYYVHALLNNYLDMDKISSLFWGFMAIIVMLDIELKESKKLDETNRGLL